jgi:hypothetical protein
VGNKRISCRADAVLAVVLGKELPDGVGGVERRRRWGNLDLEKRRQQILGQKRLGELRNILQTSLSPESPECPD